MKLVTITTLPDILPFFQAELWNTMNIFNCWNFHFGNWQSKSRLGCRVSLLIAWYIYVTWYLHDIAPGAIECPRGASGWVSSSSSSSSSSLICSNQLNKKTHTWSTRREIYTIKWPFKKDLLNLKLKTELCAGLWVEVESFKQYCIESLWRHTYRGGSFASMQRLDDGEVR